MTTQLNAETLAALGAHLDAVVRAVPGVVTLYSATPAVLHAVTQLALGSNTAASLVRVTTTDTGIEILASVGVDPESQAPATAAAVASAIRAGLADGAAGASTAGTDGAVATVSVRVSRVVA
jgi:hypothetical protein